MESPRVGDPLDSNGVQEVLATNVSASQHRVSFRLGAKDAPPKASCSRHKREHQIQRTGSHFLPGRRTNVGTSTAHPLPTHLFSAATFFMIVPPGPSTANSRPCSTSLIP